MVPTLRVLLAGFVLSGLACSPGAGSRPDGSVVNAIQTGDYEVEYDGQQKKTTIGAGLMRMTRYPEDIEIVDGTLKVGGRDYGTVAIKDKVSVVAGKVVVNGQDRKASSP